MKANDKLNLLIQYYSWINRFPEKYKDILKIDKPIRWLVADEKNQYVSVFKKNIETKLIDIDITSCFPTICNFLFCDENPEFVNKINKLENKLEKNILISNTLKGTNYLKILNIISKMVILGFIFDRRDSDKVSLLEFEKDGCLIFTNDPSYFKCIEYRDSDSRFLKYIDEIGFKFHIEEYDYYIRCNHTSWFWSQQKKKLKMKGFYKKTPEKVNKYYNDLFIGNTTEVKKFKEIYNIDSFKFIKSNNLKNILNKYYMCDEETILNSTGKYEKYNWLKSKINPDLYLKTFIFPIHLFNQRNLAGIE